MTNRSHATGKHVPVRSCVICRQRYPKRDLRRLVISAGKLQLDASGKLSGRGAYVCTKAECWERAAKSDLLDKALKVDLSAADRELISSYRAVISSERVV